MPRSDSKPYREYRQPRRVKGDGSIPWSGPGGPGAGGPGPGRGKRAARSTLRWTMRLAFVALLVAIAWGTVAFLSFRSAVKARNALVPPPVMRVLDPTSGPALTSPRNILIIGADSSKVRKGDTGRADSLILMRFDVKRRAWSMLSIPRDLRVAIPGHGEDKINAAYAYGGPALTIRTVQQLTDVDINHYIQVDFDGFKDLINVMGGVEIDNPKPIRSNSFDGRIWVFPKGKQTLDGKHALAYARVRENVLDPKENDLTRGLRQQRVLQAIAGELMSGQTIRQPRDIPKAAVQPLLTDIGASEMMAFAFGKVWATGEHTLHCRLGGDGDYVDGQAVIVGGPENRATVRMWEGRQAPIKPNTAANQLAPGCTTG